MPNAFPSVLYVYVHVIFAVVWASERKCVCIPVFVYVFYVCIVTSNVCQCLLGNQVICFE